MTQRRPHVTDHAMLRYLERVVGIDVEGHRRAVEARVSRAVELGAAALVSDGYKYTLQDIRVTSVVPARSEPRHRKVEPEAEDRDER